MPATKNALIRYKVLDNCFRNPGRKYFINDLIAECTKVLQEIDSSIKSISRRQILDDIAFMESGEGWSIDLERTRVNRKVFYRYSDTSYSINNMPLNQLELGLLQDLLLNLSHLKGMPKFEWVAELIPKLKEGMVQNTQAKTFMEFDNNPFLRGVEHLETLYNAIFNKQALRIQYQTFDSPEPKTFIIHPYFLKSYNQRWFLFGYYPEADYPAWNMAIDRIKGIEEAKDKYIENTEIDWNEYFEDMVGVTRPENAQPEKIVLHFLGLRGKYVETKPLHGSQKARWLDDNTLEVQLDLIVNRELVSLLLSYGADLVVQKPLQLRKTIVESMEKAIHNYIE
ncbi:MAG: helix-turn-helix transcriptional regulator [Sphingomonadales bacterium]|jgi:predicted DNA-binding transcriptional regulator YafY